MQGHPTRGVERAHSDESLVLGDWNRPTREQREEQEDATLRPGATRSFGAGNRLIDEPADPNRMCFERDRDRILHSTAFRRLAGKTQVFVFPEDHQRTRLTHALEVAQIATAIARNLGLNLALTEAIALGHDCGHGPGGHVSEAVFSEFLPPDSMVRDPLRPDAAASTLSFDHASWGANVALAPLNLCAETLDGIRNHSWSHPAPQTPEGLVVSWADRIAYVCHDLEDAVEAGIVRYDDMPELVRDHCGTNRRSQLSSFIDAMTEGDRIAGIIGMPTPIAQALTALRQFNYDHIYMRPESQAQGEVIAQMLRELVTYYQANPTAIPDGEGPQLPRRDATFEAVKYVAGMTDRFALRQAKDLLHWKHEITAFL